MKQKLLIGLVLVLIVAAMIGLNAASYVQKQETPDSEAAPNRSSYNAGATGTRGFYELLSETGRKVTRWQTPPSTLNQPNNERPSVFVLIGPFRRAFEDHESDDLLKWVAEGGRLVIVDRNPSKKLLTTTADWQVAINRRNVMMEVGVDPADQRQMTVGEPAIRPFLPTTLTAGVNAVQPSKFASSVEVTRNSNVRLPNVNDEEEADYEPFEAPVQSPTPIDFYANPAAPPPPAPKPMAEKQIATDGIDTGTAETEAAWFKAPIIQFSGEDINLAAEVPYGVGRIVFVTDPFLLANGGITMADNAQFAINLVDTGGLIAFDEYHHGFGLGKNRMIEYFSGTPVIAIFLQLCVLIALGFYSQSRRFARPVPEPEPDRLSKLEYVAAMAELQRRTRAYDLALENIYTDFRRRAARLLGVDPSTTPRREIANRISERTNRPTEELDDLMRQCEDIIHGDATNQKTAIRLAGEIRQLESELRLSRRTGGSV